MIPDSDGLRRLMGRFATGVAIVTTGLEDDLHGMTANSVASISLEPPLMLVCIDKASDTHDLLAKAGVFAVSVLGRDQAHLAERFATKQPGANHDLDGVWHHFASTGSPIIDGCLAYFDCRTVAAHDGGDHTVFIGEVLDAGEMSEDGPLVFYRGRYRQIAPE